MPRTPRIPRTHASRLTVFVTLPVCVRCAGQSMARHRDGVYRCVGCSREVLYLDGQRMSDFASSPVER